MWKGVNKCFMIEANYLYVMFFCRYELAPYLRTPVYATQENLLSLYWYRPQRRRSKGEQGLADVYVCRAFVLEMAIGVNLKK
jgi:hypothetical protein